MKDYDAASEHYRCLFVILVNIFDFSVARALLLAGLQKERTLRNWAYTNEHLAFWILDAITDEAWQAATDWELVEDIRSMFADAIQGQEYGDILDQSYDWNAAKSRCSRIIEDYEIKIAVSQADLETRKVF